MKKNFLFLPVSLPIFIVLLALPFMLLAVLALVEISPGPALSKTLGLSVMQTVVLYLTVLLAGIFNVPVAEFKSKRDSEQKTVPYLGQKYALPVWHGHNTVVSLNLGGCLVALIAALYFAISLPLLPTVLAIIAVALGVYLMSRPSRSIGFYVPLYVPPAIAVLASIAALYAGGGDLTGVARLGIVAGVVGSIIGTAVLNLPRLRKLGTSFISVGGLGSFDGIILTGVLATIVGCVIASL